MSIHPKGTGVIAMPNSDGLECPHCGKKALVRLTGHTNVFQCLYCDYRHDLERESQFPRNRKAMLGAFIALVVLFIVIYPIYMFWGSVENKEKAKLWIELVGTVATIAGGAAVIFNIRQAQENIRIAGEKLTTERFSKGVEQLGDLNSIETRIGGIYLLGRIAKDSERDHKVIMSLLAAFIRRSCPQKSDISQEHNQNAVSTDIQAALDVIGGKAFNVDFLIAPNSEYADLQSTWLKTSDLSGVNFSGFNLSKSNLSGSNLSPAKLIDTKFIGADLTMCSLKYANLFGSNLSRATLIRVDLKLADLSDANLSDADLSGADLSGANLCNSDLKGADLSGANLTGAKNINAEQVKAAKNWEKANFDPDFHKLLNSSSVS